MRNTLCVALLLAVGCSSADATFPDPPSTPPDAGEVSPDGSSPDALEEGGAVGVDGGTMAPDATPDSGAPLPDAAPDSGPPSFDAGTDAPRSADALDAAADGATLDSGTDAPRLPDAGSDARDGATSSDAGLAPICVSPYPACAQAIESDALVQATFPQPCSPDDLRKCGGVYRGVVETLPLVCRGGRWRLAGAMYDTQWVAGYMCSAGCAQGKLCDP
jgi:hypothetical protein